MNISLLGVTAAMLSALVAACILPQRAERGDDAGDGRAVVLIPRPVPTSRHRPRTWAFLGISALLGLVFVGLRRLGREVTYARYEGEEHWPGQWSHANAADYLNRVVEFFETHLAKSAAR